MVLKIFYFHPRKLGKMNPFWLRYFSNGLKPPTSDDFGPNQGFYTGNIDSMMLLLARFVSLSLMMIRSLPHCLATSGMIPKKNNPFRWSSQEMMVQLLEKLSEGYAYHCFFQSMNCASSFHPDPGAHKAYDRKDANNALSPEIWRISTQTSHI